MLWYNYGKCRKGNVSIPIPTGYEQLSEKSDSVFIIRRKLDSSEFVWVPIIHLSQNGIIDGKTFQSSFGRRNFREKLENSKFNLTAFHEELTDEFQNQYDSVKKYGGFYIARYAASKSENGTLVSLKGNMPWINVSFYEAKDLSASFEESEAVSSHLMFASEYDTILEWLLHTGCISKEVLLYDSSSVGNYSDSPHSPRKIVEVGSNTSWCLNEIYDLAGNTLEWTQECYGGLYNVMRGGAYDEPGSCTIARREYGYSSSDYSDTSFRIALTLK